MIQLLKGSVASKSDNTITLLANSIGFAVQVPHPDTYEIGTPITLTIYMHWNQEQGPSLYGFTSEAEKKIFELIISCSGIGPRIGLAILSAMSPGEFITAIQNGNEAALSSVNGIGSKKAEQIIVSLKHKVAKLALDADFRHETGSSIRHQVAEVLKSLNYSKSEIHAAMNYLQEPGVTDGATFDALMRKALSFLAKKA